MTVAAGRLVRLRSFEGVGRLRQEARLLLECCFERACSRPCGVLLAGGQTPLEVYRSLALRPPVSAPTLWVLQTDERQVPSADPASNYGHLAGMLRAMKVPARRVLRVHTAGSAEDSAARYDRDLRAFFHGGGVIELGLLGLGADGHVASLFREDQARLDDGRLAIAVQRPDGLWGVSVTRRVLSRARRLVFLAAGEAKAAAVARLVDRPDSLAAGLAVQDVADVEIWYSGEG